MTWTSIDDGLNHNPQTRPGAVGNTALGLWVRLCVFTAEQMRYPAFDGAFDLATVRDLRGTRRQVDELLDAGMIEDAARPGRWIVVEAATLMKFTGANGELRAKRAAAGRAGGLASARSRRSKTEASASSKPEANAPQQNEADDSSKPEANGSSKTEASASSKPEANAPQQNEADDSSKPEANGSSKTEASASSKPEASASQQNEATGHTIPNPSLTTPNPSATKTGPDATAGHQSDTTPDTRAATMADAEARIRADPLQAIAGAYPKPGPMGKPAYRERARKALGQALTDATPETLYGAALAYAKAVDNGDMPLRYAPLLANWLTGEWRSWTPQDRPRDHEWRGITSQWMRDQIHRQSPGLPITDSLEQAFWASVKSGTPALDAIRDLTAQTTKEPRP